MPVRALLAPPRETFLDVVTRCAEEDAHRDLAELDLARTVRRSIGFERRARDLQGGGRGGGLRRRAVAAQGGIGGAGL